jgi:hypothetical protein
MANIPVQEGSCDHLIGEVKGGHVGQPVARDIIIKLTPLQTQRRQKGYRQMLPDGMPAPAPPDTPVFAEVAVFL